MQNEKLTNRHGLKFDKFGFVDLSEKIEINEEGFLFYLIISCAVAVLLAWFQPSGPGQARAVNFNAGGSVEASFGGDGSELIDSILVQIRQGSGGQASSGPGATGIPGGSNYQGTLAPKAGGFNQPEIIIEKDAMPEVKSGVNLDKLAHAVSVAETSGCKKGYALSHNNCFGIKKGNTYPCKTKKGSRMCNFSSQAESFIAFKVIWSKVYGGGFPTRAQAAKWTGNQTPSNWLANVSRHYYN